MEGQREEREEGSEEEVNCIGEDIMYILKPHIYVDYEYIIH